MPFIYHMTSGLRPLVVIILLVPVVSVVPVVVISMDVHDLF